MLSRTDACRFRSSTWASSARPGLLVGTKASPVILTFKDDGSAEGKPLVTGDFPAKDLGEAGRCLVADFDGDSYPGRRPNVRSTAGCSTREKAPDRSLRRSRTKSDSARDGTACASATTTTTACPISWSSPTDGVPALYQNLGGGKFRNVLPCSGSFGYISKSGGICCQTIDINNDGRQDIFVAYGDGLAPQIFFNRGFRCFGLARKLDSQLQSLLPQAADGQQAGCVADFTGHNAMDMFLVLGNGELWLLPRKVDGTALAAVATLSTNSPCAGPVVVHGRRSEPAVARGMDRFGRRTRRILRRDRDGAADAQVAAGRAERCKRKKSLWKARPSRVPRQEQ